MGKSNIATISEKIRNIERILIGNGTKGLLKKIDELYTEIIPALKEELNRLKNYSHIKNWILGGTIAFLMSALSILITYFYLK